MKETIPSLTIVTPKGSVTVNLLTAEVKIDDGVLVDEVAKTFWEEIKVQGKSLIRENANLRATIAVMHKLMTNTMDEVNELFTLTIAGYREEGSE